jgi:hypothetical protein
MFLAHVAATVLLVADPDAFAATGQSESNSSGFVRLPASDTHYQLVKGYVEDVPDRDYRHAPEAACEAFRDLKLGMRIHSVLIDKWSEFNNPAACRFPAQVLRHSIPTRTCNRATARTPSVLTCSTLTR